MIHVLDLLGTAVFAITGALAALRKRLDFFGVLTIAVVTAIGGGTFRDLLLGTEPIFWMAKTSYLAIAVGAAIGTIFLRKYIEKVNKPILLLDALGLAAFAVIGTAKGLAMHTPPVVAILMGMLTGVGGGMIRDVFCAEIPIILQREIYAFAAFAGGTVYVIFLKTDLVAIAPIFSIMTTVALRMGGIYQNWFIPFKKIPWFRRFIFRNKFNEKK